MVEVKKLFITGANGFVGSAVINCFSQTDQFDVHALSRTPFKKTKGVTQHHADLCSPGLNLDKALAGVDTVIHLAARAHVLQDTCKDPLQEFRKTNVVATVKLAEKAALASMKRFIFISSIGVHGNFSNEPFTEHSELKPVSDYAVSKLEAEGKLKALASKLNFELVIIRPVLVYGVEAPGNFKKLVTLVRKSPVLPFGLVDNRRSFISVDNLTSFIRLAVVHPAAANECFVIADEPVISIKEFTNGIAHAFDRLLFQLPIPVGIMRFFARLIGKERMAEQLLSDLEVDCSKARKLLNWESAQSFDQAMSRIGQLS